MLAAGWAAPGFVFNERILVGEEYLFDFHSRIALIFHSHWSERDYVLLIVLVGPMVWILGGIGLWLRHPLGNFIVWFMLVGMIWAGELGAA